MDLHCHQQPEQVAAAGARFIASLAREAIKSRGSFTLAVSGGSTPWGMLNSLAQESLPWQNVHIFQVDERVAPDADAARNLVQLQSQLINRIDIPKANVHAMPVTHKDLQTAVRDYVDELNQYAGTPPVLDLVHLGLGSDGHTASLVPGDGLLTCEDRDVAVSGMYQGHLRMTLTYPVINRARNILWLVMGADKKDMLAKLIQADPAIPAGRVSQEKAFIFTDIEVSQQELALPKKEIQKC